MCSCHLASLASGYAPECLCESCTGEPKPGCNCKHDLTGANSDPSLDLLPDLLQTDHAVLSCLCYEDVLVICFQNFICWHLQILFWKGHFLSSLCSACLVTGGCSVFDTGPSICLHWTSQGIASAFPQPLQVPLNRSLAPQSTETSICCCPHTCWRYTWSCHTGD